MNLYLIVDNNNNYIAVIPAFNKDKARWKTSYLTNKPVSTLIAERLVDNIFTFGGM